MPLSKTWYLDRLKKKARKPGGGHPIASIAFYGPTAKFATKVVVGITEAEDNEARLLERWHSPDVDIRHNPQVLKSILEMIELVGAKTVVMPDQLLGCPHEEGIDYPAGEHCPACPYWKDRDRFSGLLFDNKSEH